MIFGYTGTFGEPQVFQALVGKPVKYEQRIVDGVELIYQDTKQFGDSRVQTVLDRSWKEAHFYGAFGLRPKNGVQTKVTFYDVDDDLVGEVVEKLKDWNMHKYRWFEMDEIRGIIDGRPVTFLTERLLGRYVVSVPAGFETDIWYRRFVDEMTQRLQKAYGTSEGQKSVGAERF